MQHISVRMVSNAPEFLKALVELNITILAEALQYGSISAETQKNRTKELDLVVEQLLATRKVELVEQLRCLYSGRRGAAHSAEQEGSLQEGGGGEGPEEVGM